MFQFRWKILIIAVLCCGCSLLPFRRSGGPVRASDQQLSLEVMRPELFDGGGKVMVGLFRAGTKAEATAALDRFSLTVLKGIADTLEGEGSRFIYVRPDADEDVDFVIDGHIDEFRPPGILQRLMLKRDIVVRISAELRDLASGDAVAVIRVRKKARSDRRGIEASAYGIGMTIGRKLIE